jgi:leader peptidase (prepilin peptidase)/N-methyltransferase
MQIPLWLIFLVMAPFIGSFLGVLVTRLPAAQPIVVGRSECDACRHLLSPLELIPIMSWLWVRGRCRQCAAPL